MPRIARASRPIGWPPRRELCWAHGGRADDAQKFSRVVAALSLAGSELSALLVAVVCNRTRLSHSSGSLPLYVVRLGAIARVSSSWSGVAVVRVLELLRSSDLSVYIGCT